MEPFKQTILSLCEFCVRVGARRLKKIDKSVPQCQLNTDACAPISESFPASASSTAGGFATAQLRLEESGHTWSPAQRLWMEDRMDEGLPLSLPSWGSSQVTLCESVGLCVAGKRSFDGCGFRSGCPVVSAHGCDTVNHAAITHARRHLHGRCTHRHTRSRRHSCAKEQTVHVHFAALLRKKKKGKKRKKI